MLEKPALDMSDIRNDGHESLHITSFIPSLLEHDVYSQLFLFLAQNDLQDSRFGFKVAHTTEPALVDITEELDV